MLMFALIPLAIAGSLLALGHRFRRGGLFWTGLALAAPSLGILAVGVWVHERGIDPTPYQPVWWLRHDLDAGPPSHDAALAELVTRVTAGHLSASQVAAVADQALAAQASPAPWDPAWGRFVEAAHAAGSLDPARWGTYARQAIVAGLAVPPVLEPNQALTLSAQFGIDRCVAAGFAAQFDYLDLRVDGVPVPMSGGSGSAPGRHAGSMSVGNVQNSIGGSTPQADWDATRALRVGPHTATAVLRLFVFDPADWMPAGFPVAPPVDPAKQLVTYDVPVSAPFTVPDPAAQPHPTTAVDPANRRAVAAAVHVGPLTVRDTITSFPVRFAPPPVPLRFTVHLRPDGTGPDIDVGTVSCAARVPGWANLTFSQPLGDAQHVDVIFQPEAGPITRPEGVASIDPQPIWGEPIVIHNVPVTRPQ